VTTDRDRILSEFIDAWNAGRRPSIDEYLARVPEPEREGLLEDITSYISWGPTPAYDDAALAQIRAEPAMAAALSGYRKRPASWPALLAARRQALALSADDLAARLVNVLGLASQRRAKTRDYLERAERGELDASRFAPRLLDALAELLQTSRRELRGAAGTWMPVQAAPAFRAGDDAAMVTREHLELMADAAAAPSEADWDEVDDLFRGGR
jgi:hypothetical protein